MANRIAGRPWVLDTAGSTLVWPSWIKIAHFEFSGYTSGAADSAVLNDINGDLVWQAKGLATLEDQDSFKIGWVQGLKLATLTSGKVVVYIE